MVPLREALGYDEPAADRFESLRRFRVRIGTLDLRVASIALADDALLVSRDLADFSKVPGLRIEDWTKPAA